MLGGGAAFVIDLLDPRVRSMTEMRAALDVPVLAAIPQLSPMLETGGIELLSHRSPHCFLAESYKSARTNLEFLRRMRGANVLLVSSSNPGEGKTTTASNLAISLAHAGRRVLLIDGDLRKPSLHAIYQLDRDWGLTSVLSGRATASEVIQATTVEHLDVITAGPAVLNPSEQLASRHFGELLGEVRPSYDLVIVDSSPLLAVTDPSIISATADALLLVTRMEASRRQDIERAMELIRTLGIPILGAVVNGVGRSHLGYGYSHAYGSPYGSILIAGPSDPVTVPDSPREMTMGSPSQIDNTTNDRVG